MKRWLRFTRAHTLPLETIPAICAAALAGGNIVQMAAWGLFGALYHLTGYGMNSYSDWKNGFDKEDEHKQHHPLNTGKISEEQAKRAVLVLGTITGTLVGVLVINSLLALGVAILGVLMGVAYNELGKYTRYKFVFISLAHTSVFAVPYLALSGPDWVFAAGSASVFLWVVFQIAVSGEMKDITTDEENYLKSLGVRVKTMRYTQTPVVKSHVGATAVSVGLRMLVTASVLVLYIAQEGKMSSILTLVIIFVGFVSAILAAKLVETGRYIREKRIETMSTIETATLCMFTLACIPSLSIRGSLLLIIGSAGWVLAFNQLIWSSWVAPQV